MAQMHNPPDHDEAPPPYTEAANTAYNPAFMPNLTSQQASAHASTTSNEPGTPSTAPSAPPLSTIADSAPSTPLPQAVSPPPLGMYPGGVSSPQQPYPHHTYYHHHHQEQHLVSGPQQQYYQTMPIPQHQHQSYFPGGWTIPQQLPQQRQQRYFIDSSERRFPLAALFFLFGWICPPLWILGACCCSGSRNRYEAWWGKANFIMAVMFIISSLLYSMMAITVGDWMIGLHVFSLATA
ncbi:hypothetical protein O0I10_003113 [Lichtheimia ornata]|uniref:Uncharacterized protein n=1 Tax=Lichtheimia ornata TaxID=688661 RepID=A0AAD7VBX5_9FUNG|nr:uncharacterized protein O0I10_003113 [Lichtheimia ornata]KAJ8661361.1 hypothetical protein O0I10_003113 [Lichtheimia ornata]